MKMKIIVSLIAIFGIVAAQASPMIFKQNALRPCILKVEHQGVGTIEYILEIKMRNADPSVIDPYTTMFTGGTISGNNVNPAWQSNFSCSGISQGSDFYYGEGILRIGVGESGSGCSSNLDNCRAQYDWGYSSSYERGVTGYVVVDHDLSSCPPITLTNGATQAFGAMQWSNSCSDAVACSVGTRY